MHFYCILVKLHLCFCSVSIKPVNGFFSPLLLYLSISLSLFLSPSLSSPHSVPTPFSLHALGRTALMLCFSRIHYSEPVLLNVYGPRNWFQGMNSASLICSLAGRYDNPIPPRFLAPMDFLKIPALNMYRKLYWLSIFYLSFPAPLIQIKEPLPIFVTSHPYLSHKACSKSSNGMKICNFCFYYFFQFGCFLFSVMKNKNVHIIAECNRDCVLFSLASPGWAQGLYSERIDLWYEAFFLKRDKACNWMIARD